MIFRTFEMQCASAERIKVDIGERKGSELILEKLEHAERSRWTVAGEKCRQSLTVNNDQLPFYQRLEHRETSLFGLLVRKDPICRWPSLAACCGNRPSFLHDLPAGSNLPQLKPPRPRRIPPRKLRRLLHITSRKLQKDCRESLLLLARPLAVLSRVSETHSERLVAGLGN